jgi:ATP-dependent DNA ligase
VAFKQGVTRFVKLQERMQVEHPSAERVRRVPVWLYLFDLLYLGRYDTRLVPLRYRKQVLRDAFQFRDSLRFAEHCDTEGGAYNRKACSRGWDGVIAKNSRSVYVSGRTRDWLKFKCRQSQEFVIDGNTDPRGHRIGFGALLLGVYRSGKLVYAGKVGTGRRLGQLGRECAAPCPPRVHSR